MIFFKIWKYWKNRKNVKNIREIGLKMKNNEKKVKKKKVESLSYLNPTVRFLPIFIPPLLVKADPINILSLGASKFYCGNVLQLDFYFLYFSFCSCIPILYTVSPTFWLVLVVGLVYTAIGLRPRWVKCVNSISFLNVRTAGCS